MSDHEPPRYNARIAMHDGDPPFAYRPGVVLMEGHEAAERLLEHLSGEGQITPLLGGDAPGFDVSDFSDSDSDAFESDDFNVDAFVAARDSLFEAVGMWFKAEHVADAPAAVEHLVARGHTAHLDIVYFANGPCCGMCPPHPALAVEIAASPWGGHPWGGHPWGGHPWGGHPWGGHPWGGHAIGLNPWISDPEQLNLAATGKPPTSTAMPALPPGPMVGAQPEEANGVVIGVLDSGMANGALRPPFLNFARISGPDDVPSQPMGGGPADDYLDPVAGHGTFIAGVIEQRVPGCTISVSKVFFPQGDVDMSNLATELIGLVLNAIGWGGPLHIVNLSFGGTDVTADGLFELVIRYCHEQLGIVFVAAAGNEGSCVEQFPAAMPEVIAVAALGPDGPAAWTNYGDWIDACAPGSNLVSSFFADFDGARPPINGVDPDDYEEWATWSGTSFAAPVVVAALAREMLTSGVSPAEAVERIIRAPYLTRFPNMGTIVNF